MRRVIVGLCALWLLAGFACAPAPASAPTSAVTDAVVIEQFLTPAVTAEPTAELTETPSVTSEPTLEPTPVPVTAEQLDNGALDGFFDGAVLIGDSLTAGLTPYALSRRGREGEADCLGQLRFASASAFSLERAYLAEIGEYFGALKYRTKYMNVSDAVVEMQATRAFILLGVGDIGERDIAVSIDYLRQIVGFIREKASDTDIILISPPPVLATYAAATGNYAPDFNAAYAEALCALCTEIGVGYLDLGVAVRGEDGYLIPEYCCDEKFHFNNKGKQVWVRQMRVYARGQYELGRYTP